MAKQRQSSNIRPYKDRLSLFIQAAVSCDFRDGAFDYLSVCGWVGGGGGEEGRRGLYLTLGPRLLFCCQQKARIFFSQCLKASLFFFFF